MLLLSLLLLLRLIGFSLNAFLFLQVCLMSSYTETGLPSLLSDGFFSCLPFLPFPQLPPSCPSLLQLCWEVTQQAHMFWAFPTAWPCFSRQRHDSSPRYMPPSLTFTLHSCQGMGPCLSFSCHVSLLSIGSSLPFSTALLTAAATFSFSPAFSVKCPLFLLICCWAR